MQSKRHSLLEAIVGTSIGYVIAVCTQVIVYPWFGLKVSIAENLAIASIFTIVSIIRSYFIRRLFNWWSHGRSFGS